MFPQLSDVPGPEWSSTRRVLIVSIIAAVLLVEIWLHWNWLPYLRNPRLLSLGGLAEVAIWLLLASVLVAVQTRRLPESIYWLLTIGLAIWLVSQTADLMDEFLRQPIWLSVYGEDSGRVVGMFLVTLGVISLIRHSAIILQKFEFLSFRDALTGLFNRRMFQRSVESRGDGEFALMLMDLDHFKHVNDQFGHDAGDKVLQKIAELLRREFTDHGEIFRLGGEEFAVTMQSDSREELEQSAEEARKHVAALQYESDVSVTISIGTGMRRESEPLGEFMRRVDRALYRAKDAGRNLVMSSD